MILLISSIFFIPSSEVFAEEKGKLNIENPKQLKDYVDQYFQANMEKNHVPGAIITIVKDGKVLLSEGYGYRDLEGKIPVQVDQTTFRIGSVTKNFTTTAIMQLYEQGKLDLHADVNKYLKNVQLKGKGDQPITIHHLLTHTVGYDESFKNMGGTPMSLEKYISIATPAQVRNPGTEAVYSNYSYAVLGKVVEDVSGQTYEQYIQSHIFDPLEMKGASFGRDSRLSKSYLSNGSQIVSTPYMPINGKPAGDIHATAPDLAKYMMAQLQSGKFKETLLKQQSSELMQSTHFSIDSKVSGIGYGLFEDVKRKHRAVVHGGSVDGFQSLMYLIPEKGVGIFLSTNGAEGFFLNDTFVKQFNKDFYPDSIIQTPSSSTTPMTQLKSELEGQYRTMRHAHHGYAKVSKLLQSPVQITVIGDGKIQVQLPIPGSDKLTFVEKKPYYFEEENGEDQLFVYKAKDGETHFSFSSLPFMPFEKLEIAEVFVPILVFGIFTLVLILTINILPSGWLIHLLRKTPHQGAMSRKWVVWVASVFYLGFLAVHVANLLDPYKLMGPKTIMWDLFTYLPILPFGFFLYQGWQWFKAERKQAMGWWRKISGDVLILTGILLMPWMVYWNLVGEFF
ncbi:serine hydrolase domain-containing protein [Hazenella coriacea]|nr:serine hydrolase domain-containing protein [Hazenella coriacea]